MLRMNRIRMLYQEAGEKISDAVCAVVGTVVHLVTRHLTRVTFCSGGDRAPLRPHRGRHAHQGVGSLAVLKRRFLVRVSEAETT
jgi:hypothetical protein